MTGNHSSQFLSNGYNSMTSTADVLVVNSYLADQSLDQIKNQVLNFMSDRPKDEFYFEFINWHCGENEMVVYTEYSSLDILLPITIKAVRGLNIPEVVTNVNCTITYAVLNGWIPVNQLAKGHKHLCVLEFADGIPDVFKLLSELSDTSRKNKLEIVIDNSA